MSESKKILPVLAILSLLLSAPAAAQAASPGTGDPPGAAPAKPGLQVDLGLSPAWCTDGLRWNIAASLYGGSPDILSELTWSGLQSAQVRASVRARSRTLLLLGELGGGPILAGSNQDSDYNGDGRTLEFSRSTSDAGSGWMLEGFLGVGPRFRTPSGRLEAAPLAGASVHYQGLRMTDGEQVIPALGPFPGLNSRYETRWLSGWLGGALRLVPARGWTLELLLAAHLADYQAAADWNLRDEFAHPTSFRHDASGFGLEARLQAGREVAPRWRLTADLELRHWRAGNGTDVVYMVDGSTSATRLNEVVWNGVAVRLGLEFSRRASELPTSGGPSPYR